MDAKQDYCDVLECAEYKPCAKHQLSLHTLLLLFGDNEHKLYKYKWCNESDCIVEMRKPTSEDYSRQTTKIAEFKCNEDRNVANPFFAKFRCNGLFVTRIYDLVQMTWVHSAISNYQKILTHYQVGSITFPTFYNEVKNIICTHGIHYFNRVEAAIFYRNSWCKLLDLPEIGFTDDDGYIRLWSKCDEELLAQLSFLYNEYQKQKELTTENENETQK